MCVCVHVDSKNLQSSTVHDFFLLSCKVETEKTVCKHSLGFFSQRVYSFPVCGVCVSVRLCVFIDQIFTQSDYKNIHLHIFE